MARFDWQLNFLSIHACRVPEQGKRLETRRLLETASIPEGEDVLESLLDGLLLAAFSKKPDTGKTSACKVYAFLGTSSGEADRRLLTRGLEAEDLATFGSVAEELAVRYSEIDEARPALTLFVRARVTTPNDVTLPFLVMFACDFEEASLLGDGDPGLLERVGEAVVHRLKKAILYPFLDAGLQDPERLVLIQNSSAHLDELLALEVPKSTPELFTQEVRAALAKRVESPDDYERYFAEPPPPTRQLFGEERYVRLEHLLPRDEVKHVSDVSFGASREKFDKEMKLRVKLGDFGRFEARMDRFNRDFFFARRGDEKYLIVRAEDFTTKDQLTPVEFMDVDDLEEVFKNLLE